MTAYEIHYIALYFAQKKDITISVLLLEPSLQHVLADRRRMSEYNQTTLLGHVSKRLGEVLLAEGQLANSPDLGVLHNSWLGIRCRIM